MTASCGPVETDWPPSQQDEPEGRGGYQSSLGRHAAERTRSLNFTPSVGEEWMSQPDIGECSARPAGILEEEVLFFLLVFGLRSAAGEVPAFIRVTLRVERHDGLR